MQSKTLGTLTLAMITVAAIVSLRNLPLTAELGSSALFFLALAGLLFFIPIGLVTAELAAAWPRSGGSYVWVGEAFGKPLAFITLWFSWGASIAWFPAILAFTATMLAHILTPLFPGLENDTGFILSVMLVIFWSSTLFNFKGIQASGIFTSIGVILGTLVPGALIILLGIAWVCLGKPSQISLQSASLIPDLKLDNLSLFAGVILSFAGVELSAYHVLETKNPSKSYPRALIIAMALILSIYLFGTFAISVVVPVENLSIASGLVQAFAVFFNNAGLSWAVPLIACALLLGAIAGINSWIVGPAKGMLIVAQDGFLPEWLTQVNKNQVPTALLLLQAVVGSILAMVFLYLRDNDAAIWFLTALSSQFTCLQYILMFCAVLKLRYSQAEILRPFKVPVICLFATAGILACLFSFLIVYVPNTKLIAIDHSLYCLLLIVSLVALSMPAVLLILMPKFLPKLTLEKI